MFASRTFYGFYFLQTVRKQIYCPKENTLKIYKNATNV